MLTSLCDLQIYVLTCQCVSSPRQHYLHRVQRVLSQPHKSGAPLDKSGAKVSIMHQRDKKNGEKVCNITPIGRLRQNLLRLTSLAAVFLGRYAHILLEVFAEEGLRREVELGGNLLHA